MDMWAYCYQSFASEPEDFYPIEFQYAADAILDCDFGISYNEITLDNAHALYLHLIHEFNN